MEKQAALIALEKALGWQKPVPSSEEEFKQRKESAMFAVPLAKMLAPKWQADLVIKRAASLRQICKQK